MRAGPELDTAVFFRGVLRCDIDDEASGWMRHCQARPQVVHVAVQRLRLATGTVAVAAVKSIKKAIAEHGLAYLNGKGVGDDIAKDKRGKGRRTQHEMARQATRTAPLLGVVKQLCVCVHSLSYQVQMIVRHNVFYDDVAVCL